jgi:hypothetical protein
VRALAPAAIPLGAGGGVALLVHLFEEQLGGRLAISAAQLLVLRALGLGSGVCFLRTHA